jgi:A/G-specific adenine glycosylase
LAFRGTRDPYAILVSEAMAQQTQAARAAQTWRRFLEIFPTVSDLAASSPADVVRAWRGLGYNRRALALRRTAIEVVEHHGGVLPRDLVALQRLPGIGPYTARAVMAFAFGMPVGAVDTNVRRVLTRWVAADGSASEAEAEAEAPTGDAGRTPGAPGAARAAGQSMLTGREIQALADAVVAPDRPGDWTHALMDIGAMFCRPRAPRCPDCPAQAWCRTGGLRAASSPRNETLAPLAPIAADRPLVPPPSSPVLGAPVPLQPAAAIPSRSPATNPPRIHENSGPFASTSRWLRGRILDRLRDAPDGEWVALGEQIGGHGPEAIHVALVGLQRDGLVELGGAYPACARLPLA